MQFVPHAFLLGFEVALVVLIGLYFDGHILNNFKAVGFEADTLDGVVGE